MTHRTCTDAQRERDAKILSLAHVVRAEGLDSPAFTEMFELIMRHWVASVMRRYSVRSGSATHDDMRSAAAEAVMRSVNDWDPDSGKPFAAYVTRAISNAVSKANAEARVWETGRDSTRHLSRLRMIRDELEDHGELRPSPQRIAEVFCVEKADRFRKSHPEATDGQVEAYLRKNGYAKVRDDLSWADRLDGADRLERVTGEDGRTLGDTTAAPEASPADDLAALYAVAESVAGGADQLRVAELHGSMSAARECGDHDTAAEVAGVLSGAGRAPAAAVKRLRDVMGSPQALFVCLDPELEDRVEDAGYITPVTSDAPRSVAELCRVGT